jgi:hypothetical protein
MLSYPKEWGYSCDKGETYDEGKAEALQEQKDE